MTNFRNRLLLVLLLLSFGEVAWCQNYVIKNGSVWDGAQFTEQTIYISNGLFVSYRPAVVDSTINAEGKFITPPYGDYHTHVFDSPYVQAVDSVYLSKGIFFAQDLVNDPVGRSRNFHFLQEPTTVDVSFANGAITSDYGHPIESYERMALGIPWSQSQAQRDSIKNSRIMEDRLYYIIEDSMAVEAKIEKLVATNPDVMKIVLWDSKAYRDAVEYPSENKGLDPDLLPSIVAKAQIFHLKPIAHIESEYDLRSALEAGITRFSHAPHYGYGNGGSINIFYPRLSEKTKEALNMRPGTVINPTLFRALLNIRYLPEDRRPNDHEKKLLREFHTTLLKDLANSRVSIVLGADFPRVNAIDEANYYYELGIFTNDELLNMLMRTGKQIFPDRKIGAISRGFEAHCLVLNGNPLEDFRNTTSISLRIKNGQILN